jgi:hypothetical protein
MTPCFIVLYKFTSYVYINSNYTYNYYKLFCYIVVAIRAIVVAIRAVVMTAVLLHYVQLLCLLYSRCSAGHYDSLVSVPSPYARILLTVSASCWVVLTLLTIY